MKINSGASDHALDNKLQQQHYFSLNKIIGTIECTFDQSQDQSQDFETLIKFHESSYTKYIEFNYDQYSKLAKLGESIFESESRDEIGLREDAIWE